MKDILYLSHFVSFTSLGMYEMNFEVQDKSTAQGLPYDFESVMHFRYNEMSVSCEKLTLLPQNSSLHSIRLGISVTGTKLDFLHINILYCGGKFFNLLYLFLKTRTATVG